MGAGLCRIFELPRRRAFRTLVHLAKRKGIKSQAYKAEKLGFNWRGGDVAGFAETLLGRWITGSLGIELALKTAS
jgi:hypothetical protein